MLNCKQISQLASESLEQKLSFRHRMQLTMHFAMCGICAHFNKSIKKIHSEAKACIDDIERGKIDNLHLSDARRQRIRKTIDANRD